MAGRSSTNQSRHRAVIRRTRPPCALCGNEIDYSLPHLDPWSFVIDHVIPLAKGGTDTLDNIQAAHRYCNRLKSDTEDLGTIHPVHVFVTDRTW
ncbi:HNH endonuclease family protein [Nocardia nova SH22a]|uniref:HNH endonuclease family protein n=1 Tax=Nocardia nova SH22a TaxID=1415166 RepID=W5TT45_9NOCA|nr:HNH endonuclease signature motif containing protein [Nocardia nova]AHH22093.1 HNH endonuclease family protein [Nocardia nova SH22a]